MTINIDNANAYFAPGNHVQAQVWLKYSGSNREGAVASAKRLLEWKLGRALDEETETLGRREDYAAFEQALWLLKKSAWGDGRNGDAVGVLQGRASPAAAPQEDVSAEFSPEALRWLGVSGAQVVILRS